MRPEILRLEERRLEGRIRDLAHLAEASQATGEGRAS